MLPALRWGVPPQYLQSIIAIELAVTGALLWQIVVYQRLENYVLGPD